MSTKRLKQLNPPATIGIVGGGQLGRMIAFDAKRMGYHVIVLDPKPSAPAGQVCDEQIVAGFDDMNAFYELAKKSDVLTYEFEHISADLLERLEQDGFPVFPSAKTLKLIQNKMTQKTMLRNIGVCVPDFYPVDSYEELEKIFYKLDQRIILKTCTDGYDGKGNQIIHSLDELKEAYTRFQGYEVMVEELIDYEKEVSIIVAKNQQEIAFLPIAENYHKNSILIKSLIPAKISSQVEHEIQRVAETIVNEFQDYGLFCIEFFVDTRGTVLVNEIAPRPHNSGHYSIEACVSSQYEQLVRILCGLPLGSTELRSPCVMFNLLGSDHTKGAYQIDGVEELHKIPGVFFHLYGKAETQPQKKIGHLTALGSTLEEAEQKGTLALHSLQVNPR